MNSTSLRVREGILADVVIESVVRFGVGKRLSDLKARDTRGRRFHDGVTRGKMARTGGWFQCISVLIIQASGSGYSADQGACNCLMLLKVPGYSSL